VLTRIVLSSNWFKSLAENITTESDIEQHAVLHLTADNVSIHQPISQAQVRYILIIVYLFSMMYRIPLLTISKYMRKRTKKTVSMYHRMATTESTAYW
jgi:hypothetical protein